MNPILIKIFATALTLSQVTTHPEAIKTQFDPVKDQAEVIQLLRDGCAHMRKAFDIEDINLDDLIATAMDDPKAMTGEIKAFHGINFGDLHVAYRQFCKNETVEKSVVDVAEVVTYFNKAVADLPDHTKLKGMKLPGMSTVLDAKGVRFAEVFEHDNRRIWVSLADIPVLTQKAFVAAEDKRFYEHKGFDERGLIRAFMGNLTNRSRPAGGSTITQQVAKNLVVGDDVTYERKIREMIVASRIEQTLTKGEILELYLNTIYLGRSTWGVELAARTYFGKPAKALNLAQSAMLAGLTKGPGYYSPDRFPERAKERLAYVLTRMQEDGYATPEEVKVAIADLPQMIAINRLRREVGFHFVDQIGREAKTLKGIDGLTASSYTVRSTIQPGLQLAVEKALQNGLAQYETSFGRVKFEESEGNLAEAIQKIGADTKSTSKEPVWLQALNAWRPALYDVHWATAVLLPGRQGEALRAGLRDGQIVPLNAPAPTRRLLKAYDVVFVNVVAAAGAGNRGKGGGGSVRADLRVRPQVQGAVVVLENKTGRILAMSGGFSYPASQLNRVSQSQRQAGSSFKPFTYLAALSAGLQPNTLVLDSPITLPPIAKDTHSGRNRERDYWTPRNFDRGSSGLMTMRRALENSKNLVTARLLDNAFADTPEQSLDRVCALAVEAHVYTECVRYYPFVLGAQPLRMIDLAGFYAAIANEGARPTPHVIETVEQNGRVVYRASNTTTRIATADRVAFYQLKTMLQGVLARGTARNIAAYAPFVGGKTGTTDSANDTWFMAFTNDVTIGIWVGYDNADGKRRTLGNEATGGTVAVPIFGPVIEAVWSGYAPKVALSGPTPEAARQMIALPIDLRSGNRVTNGRQAFTEYFRLDTTGRFAETQHQLVPRGEAYAMRPDDSDGESQGNWRGGYSDDPRYENYGPRQAQPQPYYQQQPNYQRPSPYYQDQGQNPYYRDQRRAQDYRRQYENNWSDDEDRFRQRQRRYDPDYFWNQRRSYY